MVDEWGGGGECQCLWISAIRDRIWDCWSLQSCAGSEIAQLNLQCAPTAATWGVVVVSKIQSQEDSLFSNQEHRTQYFKSPSGPLVTWNILRISECANCNSHSQLISPIEDNMTRQHIVRERQEPAEYLFSTVGHSMYSISWNWKPHCGYKSGTTKAHWKAIWDRDCDCKMLVLGHEYFHL